MKSETKGQFEAITYIQFYYRPHKYKLYKITASFNTNVNKIMTLSFGYFFLLPTKIFNIYNTFD